MPGFPSTLIPSDERDRPVRIGWTYEGDVKGYFIDVNGDRIHFETTAYGRDMFIAELTARIHSWGGRTVE